MKGAKPKRVQQREHGCDNLEADFWAIRKERGGRGGAPNAVMYQREAKEGGQQVPTMSTA